MERINDTSVRARGTDTAEVISVIKTTALRGSGTKLDPCRIVTQYWDFEGKHLAEADPAYHDSND